MNEEKISVLLMDDEPETDIIENTIESLRDEGFDLHLVDKITDAIEEYYEKYFDVFVLDIDMSHKQHGQETDGIKVLKRFISLHNETNIIMFSGAGTVDDWFKAANLHCFAYVDKNDRSGDPVGALTKMIHTAYKTSRGEKSGRQRSIMTKNTCPEKILVYCENSDLKEKAESTIKNMLSEKWDVCFHNSLDEVNNTLLIESNEYGIVLLLQNEFPMDTNVLENLENILNVSPKPHVIVCCRGKDEYRPSILYILNHHPFRMINLNIPQWTEQLEEALKSACTWYEKREIFKADMEALKRIKITLPPEALAEWDDVEQEDIDEFYDNEYYDEN